MLTLCLALVIPKMTNKNILRIDYLIKDCEGYRIRIEGGIPHLDCLRLTAQFFVGGQNILGYPKGESVARTSFSDGCSL